MSVLDPEGNTRYATADQLHPLAWEALGRRAPQEVAVAAAVEWDGGAYHLPLLGGVVRVLPETRRVELAAVPEQGVGYQRALVAVTYLARAIPVDPRGDWVTFRELPGGDGFFRGPHGLATPELERSFGAVPARLIAAAKLLGGWGCEGGDAAVELPVLPRIPVRVLLWSGTEEFSPAASLLTDPRAHLHLPLDVLWALTNLLVADLVRGVG